ncbi:MAG TPA: hypothetical protein VK559_11985 [Ferruginibacter sp.]|nr:hypothetical protein [Ferruginibacter sp.]
MINDNLTSNDIKAVNILHKAFLGAQLVFAAIAFGLVYNGFPHNQTLEKPLQLISVLFSIGAFIAGNQIFKKRLETIREMQDTTRAKFEIYRAACITQWSLLQGASMFSIISFLLTGDYAFLYLAGALILTFGMLSPSKTKTIYDLQLSDEEAAGL